MNPIRKKGMEQCYVLVYKLSKSDVSSLQANPTQVKDGSDLASCIREKTPYVHLKNLESSLPEEKRKLKGESSFLLGPDSYYELFMQYLRDVQEKRAEIEGELSRRNLEKELFTYVSESDDNPGTSEHSKKTVTFNKDLIAWIVEYYLKKDMKTWNIPMGKQWEVIGRAVMDADKATMEIMMDKRLAKREGRVVDDADFRVKRRKVIHENVRNEVIHIHKDEPVAARKRVGKMHIFQQDQGVSSRVNESEHIVVSEEDNELVFKKSKIIIFEQDGE